MSKSMTVAEAGRKGGLKRAQRLTSDQRKAIARKGYDASPLSVKRAKVQPNEEIPENKVANSSCA